MRRARLRSILAAQHALLAPALSQGRPDGDAWAASVGRAVRSVSSCDHTVVVMPAAEAAPPGSPSARGVRVYSLDTDPTVQAAFEAAFEGTWGGGAGWTDDLLTRAFAARRRGGPGAYHERDLTTRETVEQSPFFQQVLAPHGLRHVLGIAVPLPDGREFSVAAYYEREDAPGFTDDTLSDLALLVPAFDAGVHAYLRYAPESAARRAGFTAVVDAIQTAILVFGDDGAEVHWNVALIRLLEPETEDGRLLALVRRWVRYLAGRGGDAVPPEATVRGVRGAYLLSGVRLADSSEGGGGIVTVQAVGLPLPAPSALRERFGLTRREAEVALLLATGLSDRRIAEGLNVAYATARHHTERVLAKLAVGSRAAVAACLCEPG